MGISNKCPCVKNCANRSPAYCKTCEKFKTYKNNKMKEYEKNKRDFDFSLYESQQINRAAKKAKDFKRGLLK